MKNCKIISITTKNQQNNFAGDIFLGGIFPGGRGQFCGISFQGFSLRRERVSFSETFFRTPSKLRFFGPTKFVSLSVFFELQLMQISLNFKTFCYKLKIRRRKSMCGFSIILILKGITTFWVWMSKSKSA